MREEDISELTPEEQSLLDQSFKPGLTEKRMRNIIVGTVMVGTTVALLAIFGAGITTMTLIALMVAVVSMVEKLSYARSMLLHKSLVRKLVHRIEHLEGDKETALEAEPTQQARLRGRTDARIGGYVPSNQG